MNHQHKRIQFTSVVLIGLGALLLRRGCASDDTPNTTSADAGTAGAAGAGAVAGVAGASAGANSAGSAGTLNQAGLAGTSGAENGGSNGEGPFFYPPDGWHLWDVPPKDCGIFMPDDAAEIPPLTWESCPFDVPGCMRIPSPWADASGIAFASALDVREEDGQTWIGVTRGIEPEYEESILQRDDQVVAAWRFSAKWTRCVTGIPRMFDQTVHSIVMRADVFASPIVYSWSLLDPKPTDVTPNAEYFNPPGPALSPSRSTRRNAQFLAINENYGQFTVRNTKNGQTWQPSSGSVPAENVYPHPVKAGVVYSRWTPYGEAIYFMAEDGTATALLEDPDISYGHVAAWGDDVVWYKGIDRISLGKYNSVELWAGQLTSGAPPLTNIRLISKLETQNPPILATGGGWVNVYSHVFGTRMYSLSDNVVKNLPTDGVTEWGAGTSEVVITSSHLWTLARIPSPVGGPRYIYRFDLETLP